MYTSINFKTKKALKEALARGEKISYFQPGPFGEHEPQNGTFCLEGPHYPQAHTWYASAKAVGGYITKVK